jgi:hypothetical protein
MCSIVLVLQLERGKLYCTKVDERVNELSLAVDEYLKYLVPEEEPESLAALPGCAEMSLKELKLLPVVDQVRNLLREGKFSCTEAACSTELHCTFHRFKTVKLSL